MKKITSSIMLASVLCVATGCVSDTLALISPKTNDGLSNNTMQTKSSFYSEEANSNRARKKIDNKIKEIDSKAESKIDGFINKFFNKL